MRTLRTALVAAVAAFAATGASARTGPLAASAFGQQIARSDLVVLAAVRSTSPLTLAVTEVIRGRAEVGETVAVRLPEEEAPALEAGTTCLAFLRRVEGGCEPVLGPSSLVAIPAEGVETRFPSIARRLSAALPGEGYSGDPRGLLAALLDLMDDEDPGLCMSGALDFAAFTDLPALLDEEGRVRVLEAFRRRKAGKADKEAMALAVSAARPRGAVEGLLDGLDPAGGVALRGAIADGLTRLNDPAAPALIAARAEKAEGRARADLLALLGEVGADDAALACARKHSVDGGPAVRVEAAHALGRIARRIREAEPGTKVAGRAELAGLLAAAESQNELEAALWGLAQLDDPEAFGLLRRLAEEDPREFVRRHAALYLARPRLSLILD